MEDYRKQMIDSLLIVDREFLEVLKSEHLIANARALGAKIAYQEEAVRQAKIIIREECGIMHGDRIAVAFTNGDFVYVYDKIEWSAIYDAPAIIGRRVLKNGKLSKCDWGNTICSISYLQNVKKVT